MFSALFNVLVAVAASIAGAFFYEKYKKYEKIKKEDDSPNTGKWVATIEAHEGEEKKEDIHHIRQYGNVLAGKIERKTPDEQPPKKWKFYGKIEGRNFIAIFWGSSIGVWYVRKPRDNQWVFDGRYLSIHDTLNDDKTIKSCFNTVPITIRHDPNGMSWEKTITVQKDNTPKIPNELS